MRKILLLGVIFFLLFFITPSFSHNYYGDVNIYYIVITPTEEVEEVTGKIPAFCGDGICQYWKGENETNCPQDCAVGIEYVIPEEVAEKETLIDKIVKKITETVEKYTIPIIIIIIILLILILLLILYLLKKSKKVKKWFEKFRRKKTGEETEGGLT